MSRAVARAFTALHVRLYRGLEGRFAARGPGGVPLALLIRPHAHIRVRDQHLSVQAEEPEASEQELLWHAMGAARPAERRSPQLTEVQGRCTLGGQCAMPTAGGT